MYRVLIAAIAGLTFIEVSALFLGVDGLMMSLTVGAICACAGVHIGGVYCEKLVKKR